MILPVTTQTLKTLTPKLFTPPDEREEELMGEVLEQSQRVARGFARRRNRGSDLAFVDEAIAEAAFIVTHLIYTRWTEIKARYPCKEERHKFFRCTVGYKLKEYFSHRSTSTESYLRKKGIEIQRHSVNEQTLVQYISPLDVWIAFEAVCANELEIRVIEFYAMGNDLEMIASKCGIGPKRARKIINRIRRKLKHPPLA